MKKLIILFLAIILVMSVLAGCEKKKSDSEADIVSSFNTIGDILNNNLARNTQFAAFNGKFVYVFELKDTIYRAIAEVSEDIEQKLYELDYADSAFDKKFAEIAAPLKISKIENLSEKVPTQQELDKLIGKTGEELVNEGWSFSSYNAEDKVFCADKDVFSYKLTFDGDVEHTDDFDMEEVTKTLKVKSVVYDGIGDATAMDEEE